MERIPMRMLAEIVEMIEAMKLIEPFKCRILHIPSALCFRIDTLNIGSRKDSLSVRFVDHDESQTRQINSFEQKRHSKVHEKILACGNVRYFPFRAASLSEE
jgi:hypothetical protein